MFYLIYFTVRCRCRKMLTNAIGKNIVVYTANDSPVVNIANICEIFLFFNNRFLYGLI